MMLRASGSRGLGLGLGFGLGSWPGSRLLILSSSELARLGRPPIDLRRAFGEPHGEPLGAGSNFCHRLHIVGGCEDEQLRRWVVGEPEGEGEGEGEVEREAEERRARPISEKTLASSVRPGMFSEMRSRLFLRSSRGG